MTTQLPVFKKLARKAKQDVVAAPEIKDDPFYCESNMRWLLESIEQAKQGRLIEKTMEELRAMEK